jgi:hypothetical protein
MISIRYIDYKAPPTEQLNLGPHIISPQFYRSHPEIECVLTMDSKSDIDDLEMFINMKKLVETSPQFAECWEQLRTLYILGK